MLILQAQNILEYKVKNEDSKVYYSLTDYGKQTLSQESNYLGFKDYYTSSIELIEGNISLNDIHFYANFCKAYSTYLKSVNQNGLDALISKHIEGAIIAPILISIPVLGNSILYEKNCKCFCLRFNGFLKKPSFLLGFAHLF